MSEEELLNRVILAKSMMAYASNQTMHLRTKEGEFAITPRVARDVMRVAGQLPKKKGRAKSRAMK